MFIFIFEPRLALNLNFCVSLPNAGIIGVCHRAWKLHIFGIDPVVYVGSTFLFVVEYYVLFSLEQSVESSA